MMGSLRALTCVLALAALPAVAVAQAPTPQTKQLASDKVKKAIAKSQAGEHEAAADLYLDAYALIPQPLLLSNIGSEYQQMKKPVEALKYFCKYLEADPTGNNASYVTAQARTLYIELGGVTTVQDSELCKPIVKPKPAEPPPPPPVHTNVSVTTEPEPAPGPVDHGDGGSKTPVVRYVGIGVAVAGAGVFGVGAYFGLKAKSISDDITNHDPSKPWPADIKQKEADGASYEKKQIGFMIGGGAAVAAGVVMFIVGAPKKSSETSLSIAPLATPDTLGFAAAGRF
jgi:tetratricopeptide (TPR) repeat protein